MERYNIQAAWVSLKPLCDKLMKTANIEDVKNVSRQVAGISDALVQDLLECILYPVDVHLKRPDLSKDVKLHMVDLMRTVLEKARIMNVNMFNNIYGTLRAQIPAENNMMEVIPGYEELKESVMLCLKTMVLRSTTDVIEQYYTRDFAPKLAHGIFLCVLLARTEKSRSLRLAAMEAAMHLLQIHDQVDVTDTVMRSQVGDVVMVFLPGVAGGLMEVACGADTQSHLVTMMAIRAWGRLIALVMEDVAEPESMSLDFLCKKQEPKCSNPPTTSGQQKVEEKVKQLLKDAKRNAEWYDSANTKLKFLIRQLTDVTRHSNVKVQLELHKCVQLLLFSCTRNMKNSFSELLEIMIVLSEDESEEIASAAKQSLMDLSVKCSKDTRIKSLIEMVEENLYNFLTRLPRVIRTSSNEKQQAYLDELAGYLRFLGEQQLPRIMMSNAHLHRMLLALVYVVELNCDGISLLEDVAIANVDDAIHNSFSHPWKNFKFIYNASVEDKVANVCKLLGELGNLEILVDCMLKLMQDTPQYQKELMLLLNWVLDVSVVDLTSIPLYKQIADQYTSPEVWDVSLTVSKSVTLREARSNVVQCCLLLEGLAIIAKALNHDEHFLLKILYLVIEKAGSGQGVLRSTGLKSLEEIARTRGLETVAELLRANVDYLTYHVTMKLRRVERNPGVFNVVDIIMEHSTIDFLPSLKDIVDDVLRQTDSSWQKSNVHSFLKVFHTFAVCVRKLTVNKNESIEDLDEISKGTNLAEQAVLELLEYVEAKKAAGNLEDEESDEAPDEREIKDGMEKYVSDDKAEEEEAKSPFFVKMMEDVMKHCLHFLPSKEAAISLLSMSTLREGFAVLRDWENVLLPIVHQTWHPLVERFRHENPLVINRAWQLFVTLAMVSKDFIRSRTLKEVFPSMSDFLKKSAKESYKKDSGGVYKFTQVYKLQHELLSQLGKVTRLLALNESDQWKILGIVEPYLSSLQNPALQECCVKLYKEIVECNADIVWVKCLSIWSDRIEPIPRSDFEIWYSKMNLDSNLQNEYEQNLKLILDHIREREKSMYKL